jgi:hypothetical protein
VVFGRATAGVLRGFAVGLRLGFGLLIGLLVIVGLRGGLLAGTCFGAITAGADLTGFGRIGVSMFWLSFWLSPPACGWSGMGARGTFTCGGSTGNGAAGSTGTPTGVVGAAFGAIGSVGKPTTGSDGKAPGSGSIWTVAGGVNNAPSGVSSCVCARALESSRALASSKTRAINEAFRLFHLRGVGCIMDPWASVGLTLALRSIDFADT